MEMKKTLAEMLLQPTYEDFDFTSIWASPTATATPTIVTDISNIARVFEGTYTLRDIIQRGIDTLELRVNKKLKGGTRLTQKTKYTISPDIDDLEVGVIAPELFLNNLTFFEFLFTLGSIMNAIPYINKKQ